MCWSAVFRSWKENRSELFPKLVTDSVADKTLENIQVKQRKTQTCDLCRKSLQTADAE